MTERGHALPPVTAIEDVTPGLLIVDIGVAQTVLERPGQLSRLLLGPGDLARAADVGRLTGDELRVTEPEEAGDLARLTDSFHLNLTAFGFLAFIVGLFIVHASIGLAFEQRLGMIRTMRAVGVPLRLLMGVLVGGDPAAGARSPASSGMICGYLIAAALLPDVAASLEGLYGASVGGRLALAPAWWVSGLGMAMLGALAASAAGLLKVAQLPVLAVAHPVAWREAQLRQLRRQGLLAAGVPRRGARDLSARPGPRRRVRHHRGRSARSGALLAARVRGSAARGRAKRQTTRSPSGSGPTAASSSRACRWRLMALLLALSANVGVGTMVEGFRKTFTAWLDERLNSEIYFDAQSDADAARIVEWLEDAARGDGDPAGVEGRDAHRRLAGGRVRHPRSCDLPRALLLALASARGVGPGGARAKACSSASSSRGACASMSVLRFAIPTARGLWRTEVVGIYPDYGNPKGQVRVNVDALVAHWPEVRRMNYSLRVEPAQRSAAHGGHAGRVWPGASAASSIRPRSRRCRSASSRRRLPSRRRSTR